MESKAFSHRVMPRLGREVFRLGLAANYGIGPAEFDLAVERGVNYIFWSWARTGRLVASMQAALRRNREGMVVAAGPTLGYFGGSVRRGCERVLKRLNTDYIDYFQLYWLGVGSALTGGVLDELLKLRDEGKVRAIGVSIHDRVRAGRLVVESPFDMFMVRYNAAHPGAERDIFPAFETRRPDLVAYTATAWRKLLKRPSGYQGPVPTAGDCYRFCLSSPHVDVVLTGPADRAQLEENLAAIERGPLSAEEDRAIRAFGARAHG